MASNRPKRILLIEDNTAFRKIMKLRLEAAGFHVLTAADGLSGLQTARQEKPNLIVLDLMLPRLDGQKVCRLLKFDYRYRHIPVVILTSRDLDEDEETAKRAHADAFIVKTVDSRVIIDIIHELLSGSRKKRVPCSGVFPEAFVM
jgi:DNA-binding response OmpR family regulator